MRASELLSALEQAMVGGHDPVVAIGDTEGRWADVAEISAHDAAFVVYADRGLLTVYVFEATVDPSEPFELGSVAATREQALEWLLAERDELREEDAATDPTVWSAGDVPDGKWSAYLESYGSVVARVTERGVGG